MNRFTDTFRGLEWNTCQCSFRADVAAAVVMFLLAALLLTGTF